ncbi:MAG: membrane protein insertion efficiency factor YidD [Deltaproteobacteria bacterium]|nr:membrane protein insertion efficiency factor YidD [Deltaproteobacteria bacterium]
MISSLQQRRKLVTVWYLTRFKKNLGQLFSIKGFIHKLRYIPVAIIIIYQWFISPIWPPSCRFYPTCSTYARHAIIKYGIIKGCILSVARISKCHPFHPGGYDPLL